MTTARGDHKRHPIQVAARRSGLTPDVLRAWEKRYGLVAPGRSPSGRRLYSDEDVERLRLLREAVGGGRRIGQIAELGTEQLDTLIAEDRDALGRVTRPSEASPGRSPEEYVRDGLEAVRLLDAGRLRVALDRAILALSSQAFIDEVVTPLMHRVGNHWWEGRLTPGHEHLASTVVRQVLGELRSAAAPRRGALGLVAATPQGQRHDIGALLAAATAALEGWRVTFLGADLPAGDIAQATKQLDAIVVALSLTFPPATPEGVRQLDDLAAALPDTTHLVVGGQVASSYRDAVERVGAVRFPTLNEFRAFLRASARGEGPSPSVSGGSRAT